MASGVEKTERLTSFLGRIRRVLVRLAALLVVVVVAGYFLLPAIAGRVIRGMLADAGMEGAELRVSEVGWRRALIEGVKVRGDGWEVRVDSVVVGYGVIDLLGGEIDKVRVDGSRVLVDFSERGGAGPTEGGEVLPEGEQEGEYWYRSLADVLNRVGEVRAGGVEVVMKRGVDVLRRRLDVEIDHGALSHSTVRLKTGDLVGSVWLKSYEDSAEWEVDVDVGNPDGFVDVLEMIIGHEGDLLPEGISLAGVSLMHTFRIKGGRVGPLVVHGLLRELVYDGGEKPVRFESSGDVVMTLSVDFSGPGKVVFLGKAGLISLPLDPSAGFELGLKNGMEPSWEVEAGWGDEPIKVMGEVKKMGLSGRYGDKPVELDDIKMEFKMEGGDLAVDGEFSNGGVRVPVLYRHSMTGVEEQWLMEGNLRLGPCIQDRSLPVLSAFVDVFDKIEVAGSSLARIDFSVGSHQPFQGKMEAGITGAEVKVEGGGVMASGVSGVCNLHLIPLADDGSGRTDPSYYTFDFSAEKLIIVSKDALGFDLTHRSGALVRAKGKGHLGMDETTLHGEVSNLNLHGEKGGHSIGFRETGFAFDLKGDGMVLSGKTFVGDNMIPFSYRHERMDTDDGGWRLLGMFQVQDADLREPVENGVMIVEAMEGKSLSGRVSMKMDFTLGSEEDFDGVLTAGVENGTLSFADGGPVIEGLKGDIRLASMKTKHTRGFHRVTARRMRAFDTEMTGLRLDYGMMANGDIQLRNVAMRALGGQVWLDDFTVPGDNRDYQFKIRAKRLDVAKLAALFPDFNGSISGRVDGLLPMKSVGGAIRPMRGGMYLTPRSRAKLKYDAGNKFSSGLDPKSEHYKKMKMVEDSLRNLDLKVLSIRLFDPRDGDKAVVLRLEGRAPAVGGAPPIILNVNGFKPSDDTVDFFDLLLRHRDKLNFGL